MRHFSHCWPKKSQSKFKLKTYHKYNYKCTENRLICFHCLLYGSGLSRCTFEKKKEWIKLNVTVWKEINKLRRNIKVASSIHLSNGSINSKELGELNLDEIMSLFSDQFYKTMPQSADNIYLIESFFSASKRSTQPLDAGEYTSIMPNGDVDDGGDAERRF